MLSALYVHIGSSKSCALCNTSPFYRWGSRKYEASVSGGERLFSTFEVKVSQSRAHSFRRILTGHSSCWLLFSCLVVSNSLRPHEMQHAGLPCPSLSPGVCSNSYPLSWGCYLNHLILCHPLFLLPSIFPNIMLFSLSKPFTSNGKSIRASA